MRKIFIFIFFFISFYTFPEKTKNSRPVDDPDIYLTLCSEKFDKNKDCVVWAHGWCKFKDKELQEKYYSVFPDKANWTEYNTFTFNWYHYAKKLNAISVRNENEDTVHASRILASKLKKLFGDENYKGKIWLIGHSMGTQIILNAYNFIREFDENKPDIYRLSLIDPYISGQNITVSRIKSYFNSIIEEKISVDIYISANVFGLTGVGWRKSIFGNRNDLPFIIVYLYSSDNTARKKYDDIIAHMDCVQWFFMTKFKRPFKFEGEIAERIKGFGANFSKDDFNDMGGRYYFIQKNGLFTEKDVQDDVFIIVSYSDEKSKL